MEKMLVTQALDERDLLKKRIYDAISKSKLVATMKPNDNKVSTGASVEDFEKDAKAQLQRIKDLIDRYERLDSAILIANATEQIEVAGRKMSRASAINLRKNILNNNKSMLGKLAETDFRGMLISQLTNTLENARVDVARTQTLADKQREVLTCNISSNDKKEVTSDAIEGIDAYCKNLVSVIVDPIGAEEYLDELREDRDALIKNLESAIKISNATTYVEF